jgi:FkbM family methyltransferase
MLQGLRDSLRLRSPFKSQKGQDRWVIFEVLPMKRGGFFVDLAAADGVTHSNTYVLEKLFSWKGICIEGNPRFVDKLKTKRRCHIAQTVVDSEAGEVQFRIDNGQLGGIVADDTDNNPSVRGPELRTAEILSLPTEPLATILDRYRAPRVIDYLSLDVEGGEERIMRGFPFERYTFSCVTIERPTPRLNEIMFEAGYLFVKNVRFDTFYVHTSAMRRGIRTKPFEQVPHKEW